ncbi:TauD/TfdA family dioxygenase [Candidatus Woesebacteria bacterium]|nr:TauD/TfdA family dioxygenase [Candidatus Woesebacteria bacterium]
MKLPFIHNMSKLKAVSPMKQIQSQSCIYTVNSDEREELVKMFDSLPKMEGGIAPDDVALFEEIQSMSNHLPHGLLSKLDHFGRNSNKWGTLVIHGLPVDPDLPPTPTDGEPVDKATNYSEYALLTLLSRFGVPYADVREKKGRLIHQVSPRPGMENAQENGGSTEWFELHTENIFLQPSMIPDIFALTCLRQGHDGGASTLTMSIENAKQHLSEEDINILSQPQFLFHFSSSYGQVGRMTEPRPVIHPGNLMTVDFADMSLVSHPGKSIFDLKDVPGATALKHLKAALTQPDVILEAKWEPGTMAIIDNLRAVHARKGFKAHYDGKDRWLQRAFSMDLGDFRGTQHLRVPGSHVFSQGL